MNVFVAILKARRDLQRGWEILMMGMIVPLVSCIALIGVTFEVSYPPIMRGAAC